MSTVYLMSAGAGPEVFCGKVQFNIKGTRLLIVVLLNVNVRCDRDGPGLLKTC
jgi:hypothetical protein